MSSLLVLLALLSLAMLASRRGAFDELAASATTPVLVLLGVALSPAALGFLTPSVVEGLAPALQVGVCWLALLAGLRAASRIPTSLSGLRAGSLALVAAALSAGAAGLILLAAGALGHPLVDTALKPLVDAALDAHEHALASGGALASSAALTSSTAGTTAGARAVLPAALLVGASLAGMPGERTATPVRAAYAAAAELIVLAAALAAFALWCGLLRTGIVAGLGVLGAVVVRMLAPARAPAAPAGEPEHGDEGASAIPVAVAFIAVTTLVAGLSHLAAVPAGVAGFVAGAASAWGRGDVADQLLKTERPVRIVVTVVLAASTPLAFPSVLAGIALGVAVVGVQVLATLALAEKSSLLERLAVSVATSTTPLVAVAAFSLANVDGAHRLLPAVVIAVSLADAVSFAFSLAAHRRTAR